MARNDIVPFSSSRGGNDHIQAYPLGGGQTFDEGEPVIFSSGTLIEATNDPASVAGVAASRSGGGQSGTVRTTGTMIQVNPLSADQTFKTSNFATDGSSTAATPTAANALGATAGFTLSSGNWFVDTGAGNHIVQIEKVLDTAGHDISNPELSTGTGNWVVFRGI